MNKPMLNNCRQQLSRRLFRTIDVPHDISGITSIDRAREVDPTLAGLTQDSVDAIWQACEDLYRSGVHPLLALCLRRKGQVVLNRTIGYASPDRVATLNTPICLFSASKSVSAVLIHLLAEQGRVNLLDPVSYYVPKFGAKGKGSISIQQLLCHRGGVPSIPEGADIETLFDHKAALALICAGEPLDHQGRIQAYHAITSGFVLDELIRVTTGLTAQQYLNKYITKPMGMRVFRYGLTQRDKAAAAVNMTTGLDSNFVNRGLTNVLGVHPEQAVEMTGDPRFFKSILPSANLFATAEEASRFFQMLLNHGHWQGRQILDPLTVHRATRAIGRSELDKSLMLPMRYSAGFMMGGSPVGIFGTDTQYAYGHLGFSNIFCWADPQRDIAVSLLNTGKATLGPHLRSLSTLLGTLSNECAPIVDMDGDLPIYRRTPSVHA